MYTAPKKQRVTRRRSLSQTHVLLRVANNTLETRYGSTRVTTSNFVALGQTVVGRGVLETSGDAGSLGTGSG